MTQTAQTISHRVPGRRAGRTGVLVPALITAAVVAVTAALSVVTVPAGAHDSAARTKTKTVWLCKPGLLHDPCSVPLTVTSITANGTRNIESASSPTPSGFDCFYVYPTVSTEKRPNANLVIQRAELDVAVVQAAPFSQLCDVWAPMYRQTTAGDIAKGGIGGLPRREVLLAYRSLLSGWRAFLLHAGSRPIVLIGHSQGAALLVRLIRQEVDPNPALRSRVVVAILAGGNLQVPTGKTVGATFHHVPLCTRTGETACAIAWSSFPSEPPAGSPFGRPGKGVSIQAGEPTASGQQVACTNPAALGGGSASLDPWFVGAQAPTLSPAPTTLWVTFPGLYTAHCTHAGNATWLEVDHATGTRRPVVKEQDGPSFGYHADDVNLALGNLLEDVAAAEASYRAQR
jgi:hypothetical protein